MIYSANVQKLRKNALIWLTFSRIMLYSRKSMKFACFVIGQMGETTLVSVVKPVK